MAHTFFLNTLRCTYKNLLLFKHLRNSFSILTRIVKRLPTTTVCNWRSRLAAAIFHFYSSRRNRNRIRRNYRLPCIDKREIYLLKLITSFVQKNKTALWLTSSMPILKWRPFKISNRRNGRRRISYVKFFSVQCTYSFLVYKMAYGCKWHQRRIWVSKNFCSMRMLILLLLLFDFIHSKLAGKKKFIPVYLSRSLLTRAKQKQNNVKTFLRLSIRKKNLRK